jgi:signal transduction histidine kinase
VGRSDWVLVAGFEGAALIEGVARPDLAWRPVVTLVAMAVMPALLWRRSHPLATCLLGFGVAGLLSGLALATGSPDLGPSSMLVILILLFALVRWGSGREMAVGLVFVAAVVALGMYAASAALAEVVGGSLFVLLFVALAAVSRSRADLWQRQRREIRNEERLALARELHDTVAHHVSAIAVQAQAGGVLAQVEPTRAPQALATIEAEAKRTLEEMRAMVSVLREGDAAAYRPLPGVADLPTLARPDASPAVEVSLTGSVSGLPAPVDTAVYRIAQEALTNAVRHARRATRISIDVSRVEDRVLLRVVDDGLATGRSDSHRGFGLTGMAERAELLGGSFSAGPGAQGGWVVETMLPVAAPR